jgi:predicted enzyme related to lactoylglutathione lyase
MPRPIHFEIPADNPDRAIAFYQSAFGWQFMKWEGPQPYWLITTGAKGTPGIDGGMMPRHAPGESTVNTLQVPSLEDAVASVTKHGGKITVPKMPIPGVGWLAYCIDTEGNAFGVLQPDPAAA